VIADSGAAAPPRDCPLCPRLVGFRAAQRIAHPDWFNGPVPAFGGTAARLLITGLAPGLKGANRTGRPFTGDYAGDLLYATLAKFGLATGTYGARADDGFALEGVRITNAVRCVPPENKPEPSEILACRPFLIAELASLPRLRAILALGLVSHRQCLAALGLRQAAYGFGHGAIHILPSGLILADSYHCSRYNTNTGRLTAAMFEAVFAKLVPMLAETGATASLVSPTGSV
jgi:uracil-DNA glycosylase